MLRSQRLHQLVQTLLLLEVSTALCVTLGFVLLSFATVNFRSSHYRIYSVLLQSVEDKLKDK